MVKIQSVFKYQFHFIIHDEIERQLISDSNSDCCTEDEAYDWG
jgi:hypothetical protein